MDERVTEIAARYFYHDPERVETFTEDARVYFLKNSVLHDVVFGDAYNSFISVPWHLFTAEFTALVKERLNRNGIYAVNMVSALSGENSLLFQSVLKTFQVEFPAPYVFAFGSRPGAVQNIVLVGVNGEGPSFDRLRERLLANKETRRFAPTLIDSDTIQKDRGVLLTDDFAPVETLMIPAMESYFAPYQKRKHLFRVQ